MNVVYSALMLGTTLACAVFVVLLGACTLDREGRLEPAAGGGGGGVGGSTSSGGGGQGGGTEGDCLNGVDDDGDGDVDCMDADCVDHACVPLVPEALGYAVRASTPEGCAAPTTALELGSCDGCGCTETQGTCDVTATIYADAQCTNIVGTTPSAACYDVDPNPVGYVTTELMPGGDADCVPTNPTVAPETQNVCEVSQVGACAGSSVCVPAAIADAPTCVVLAGDVECPSTYPSKVTHHVGAGDCSCNCSITDVSCMASSIAVSATNDSCTNNLMDFPMGNCVSVGYAPSMSVPTVTSSPTCAPQASPPGGSEVRTLCCAE